MTDQLSRIRRINELRIAEAKRGDPGDPPELICEGCGVLVHACECPKCPGCGKILVDCRHELCTKCERHEVDCECEAAG